MSLLELDIQNRRRATRVNRAVRVTTMDRDYRRGLSVALNVSSTGARLVLTQGCQETFLVELDAHTQVLARPVWKRPLKRSMVVGVRFEFRCDRERQQVIRFLQRLAA
ncbi:MAG: PilZ domain-containing protein [Candidatus Eremiobacteraeota bacterium]|nr:PilZ domain-containing protein [Candidatus Eremiobacteraeota bacterium]MCW5869298.1 PilZ domain-containing protein [Candidatus Eremiobacteraeota bacterium]